MNIKALNKLESAWLRLDWREWLVDRILSSKELMELVDIVDVFKTNRQTKDLVIAKLKFHPAYVCVSREEYVEFLDWICNRCIESELYECCAKTQRIKEKLCSNSKKSLGHG